MNRSKIIRRDEFTRRDFLRGSAVVAAAARFSPRLFAAAEPVSQPVPPIGILLATTYKTGTLEERLDRAKAAGLSCVQMAMDCVDLAEMPESIPANIPGRIKQAAAARKIEIASVTGTFNMAHPDPAVRKAGLHSLRAVAEACSGMGTSKIHICTGTRNLANMWAPHPDNGTPEAWKDMLACIREATGIASQSKVVLGFEPEVGNVVDSARKARQLMDEISSPHLKVTLDPSNLFHTGELPRMDEILDEAFELVGHDIIMTHGKDLDQDGAAGHLPAGFGKMDYTHFCKLLVRYNYGGPILLHGLTEEQVPGCLAFMRRKRDDALHAA